MDRDKSKEARKAYLKRLGNPYASLQVESEEESLGNQTDISIKEGMQSYIKTLGNPYAKESFFAEESESEPESTVTSDANALPKGNLSKEEFRTRCRSIFRGYIPPFEKGRIRPHHRNFIARNESRPPAERYRLYMELVKYDLSSTPGLSTFFNRERDLLTEEKLKEIEESIKNGK
ncbi:MAG: hypothetical protein RBS57_16625 [Desulforhabdus sp.]|jgi:hypothetical protein|nr:hypothetical protein [Desulforhabdus sp.]